MKKFLIILLAVSAIMFSGCEAMRSTSYRKICYMENGRYYYLTNDTTSMQEGLISSNNLNDTVRQEILNIKELPCEIYLSQEGSFPYDRIQIIKKGDVK